jgi:RNA polymerase sigma-70 factor (ECF subfamily)
MEDGSWLAGRFEEHRARLRAVAYRMLGSVADADEAVQEAWLRVSAAGADDVENIGGWLTTIVARICLNGLEARRVRREAAADDRLPDPIVTLDEARTPEDDLVLADAVGLALQIVIARLPPPERLAFVLHDLFEVSFEEIATVMGRSEAAARQLASRGRRRVRGAAVPTPDRDLARQRRVVDAFVAAARAGDFDALVAVLDPDVVRRSDGGDDPTRPSVLHGASAVARSALAATARRSSVVHRALVNGAAGIVATIDGRPYAVMGFTVVDDRIVAIDAVLGAERLARLDLPPFGDAP